MKHVRIYRIVITTAWWWAWLYVPGIVTMALLGGRFIIDQTPAASPAVSGTLSLDVEGGVGAVQYCDEDGNFCFLPEDVANNTVPGSDRELLFNSGGSMGAWGWDTRKGRTAAAWVSSAGAISWTTRKSATTRA